MDEDEDAILARALEVLQRRAAKRTAAPGLTVRQLYERYENATKARKSWPTSRDRLLPFVSVYGARPVAELTVLDWTDFAQARRTTPLPGKAGAAGRCYSETTINQELGELKSMANWACAAGLLKYNPLAAARRTKRRKRETAPRETEIGLALAACEDGQQRVMVLCATDAGLRRGEIAQLRHDWIDHEARTINLPNAACKNGRGGTVPATQRLLDEIAGLPRHIRSPYVLVSPRGPGRYSMGSLDRWWREIRERAGLEAAPGDGAVRLHDGRAACATNALERGVRLQTVSKRILRHASVATTEMYLRRQVANPEEIKRAADTMDAGIARDQHRR